MCIFMYLCLTLNIYLRAPVTGYLYIAVEYTFVCQTVFKKQSDSHYQKDTN